MKEIFDAVNQVFDFVVPIADFLWGFPTNFDWYASIPILGNLSFAIVILIGSGIFFSIKTGFVQVTHFRKGLRILVDRKTAAVGITPLAAFFLSSAMRVGPGNIMGVTGAIAVGGPGALFWMWVSAFFGMATAFMEATLAQIFKERKGDELVGGLPFYGKKIMGNRAWVGVLLSCIFILYAMFCLPAQAFNVFSSVGSVAEIITGETFSRTSMLYCITGILLIGGTTFFAFGGIHKITAVTDKMVPVMAVIYCGTVLLIALLNIGTIPYFFGAVFGGAFTPEAVFGGFFGTALAQGVKRGLMSNEAGQGTITMSAAASDAEHPCEQGVVQALGVFLDTMVVCTLSGFIVVMAHLWSADPAAWEGLKTQQLPLYLASITSLTPGSGADSLVTLLISVCYGLFAYTCIVGFIIFASAVNVPSFILCGFWGRWCSFPLVFCPLWRDWNWGICGISQTWAISSSCTVTCLCFSWGQNMPSVPHGISRKKTAHPLPPMLWAFPAIIGMKRQKKKADLKNRETLGVFS